MRLFGYGMLLVSVVGASLVLLREPISTLAGKTTRFAGAMRTRGVVRDSGSASPGYVLFSPLLSTTTYLIDEEGQLVHTWESEFAPGASAYLRDNGNLLRCARQPDAPTFHAGGQGGRIQEFSWDGKLLWDFVFASEKRLQHHDIEPLPNGNVLLIAWEHKTPEQAIQAGRDANLLGSGGLWPDGIFEIRPERPNGGQALWEWHLWDHLIQECDPTKENYGKVSEHPELIDINGDRRPAPPTAKQLERLRGLGYLAGGTAAEDRRADFVHTNSIAYNPRLDQIALTAFGYNEIWIIDHGTTTGEAAGHTGGRAGRGGDLLYRWGNPRAYGRGTAEDQQLFGQHDARWIPDSYPGAGNLMVFNNGAGRPDARYSSVMEIEPPLDAAGRYAVGTERPFGPDQPAWEYTAPKRRLFFADFISGAHRLANGNTFVTSGPQGRLFEVTSIGKIVWEYDNPFSGDAPNPHGDPPYSVFRATHIPPDHPGLADLRLAPLDPG